jgi:pimeloyl-ACP methyl ester carboxylesterase
MPSIRLDEGLSLHCAVDDYLWPWEAPTPVLMMHGFARNAAFWNRWVPAIAESRRIYRPDLLGCGASDVPAPGYHFTPEKIAAEILAVFAAMSLKWVHWVGESSGGIIGRLLAASHPERIASLVLCNTPTRISDEIKGIYALDQESTGAAIRAHGTGEWCRRTLGYSLASTAPIWRTSLHLHPINGLLECIGGAIDGGLVEMLADQHHGHRQAV